MSLSSGANWHSNKASLTLDQVFITRKPTAGKSTDRNSSTKPRGQITVAARSIEVAVNTRPDISILSASPIKRPRLVPPSRSSQHSKGGRSRGKDGPGIKNSHASQAEFSLEGNQPRSGVVEATTHTHQKNTETEKPDSERQAIEDERRKPKAPKATKKSLSPEVSMKLSNNVFGTTSLIEFYVGSEEQLFAVHETALAKAPSLINKSRLNGKTCLTDIDPVTFKHLVLYLYTGVATPKLPENPDTECRKWRTTDRITILQLYSLAVQYDLEELTNELMDNLRANRKLVKIFRTNSSGW